MIQFFSCKLHLPQFSCIEVDIEYILDDICQKYSNANDSTTYNDMKLSLICKKSSYKGGLNDNDYDRKTGKTSLFVIFLT